MSVPLSWRHETRAVSTPPLSWPDQCLAFVLIKRGGHLLPVKNILTKHFLSLNFIYMSPPSWRFTSEVNTRRCMRISVIKKKKEREKIDSRGRVSDKPTELNAAQPMVGNPASNVRTRLPLVSAHRAGNPLISPHLYLWLADCRCTAANRHRVIMHQGSPALSARWRKGAPQSVFPGGPHRDCGRLARSKRFHIEDGRAESPHRLPEMWFCCRQGTNMLRLKWCSNEDSYIPSEAQRWSWKPWYS